MFYEKTKAEKLYDELFKNPTSEYRGAPFWAWNGELKPETLCKQIEYMNEMGFGGFYMHSRSGLSLEYLGEDFMNCVDACIKKAEKSDMKAYLYDEDRWPSGTAGGFVTKNNPEYGERYIEFSPIEKCDFNGKVLARYAITLEDGYLVESKRISTDESAENVWIASLKLTAPFDHCNNAPYVDTMNPEAIKKFIDLTHEKYKENFGEYFGNVVPTIFTDEPQFFTATTYLKFSDDKDSVKLTYTDRLSEVYKEKYGVDFFDILPELVWELPDGKFSTARYRYRDLLAEMFATAFSDTLGEWCENNNIYLTGHMMNEPLLYGQTKSVGESMRNYRKFQLPGIDMLSELREFTTAKQAQSAVHQYGRDGMMSELYGVSNWDYNFKKHKMQGDWQAALGVTHRVPHLSFYTMKGDAKRDYPASILHQSPWYKEYKLIEDHFSRVHTALTRGKAVIKVGVIHPIESFWLHLGPNDKVSEVRNSLEDAFMKLSEWLLYSQLDYNYISEALLPDLYSDTDDKSFKIGEMSYDVILVPNCETLRSTTVKALKQFKEKGGKIVFSGKLPELIDAVESEECVELLDGCTFVQHTKNDIVSALEEFRTVEMFGADGQRKSNNIYQLRQDNDCMWLFVCTPNDFKTTPTVARRDTREIRIKGIFKATEYDTMTGEIKPLYTYEKDGWTCVRYVFFNHDSLLLKLEPTDDIPSEPLVISSKQYFKSERLPQPESYELSEPNVLLLDLAEYKYDDETEWRETEDVLKICRYFKSHIGYKVDRCQPWAQKALPLEHKLTLKFTINSEIDVEGAELALEDFELNDVYFNGELLEKKPTGHFVDECYQKLKLPKINKGSNELIIEMPFGNKTNVEWAYILGDFGVKVDGMNSKIVPLTDKVVFGDYTQQTLPFYAGNMTYKSEFECTEEAEYDLRINGFGSPLLRVYLNGEDIGAIFKAPFIVNLGILKEGKYTVEILAYGNRYNAFGDIHSLLHRECIGPNEWYNGGENYSYEYQFRPIGVIKTPEILKVKKQ